MRRIHIAPEGGVLGLGQDDRVLDGDPRLVVVAVQHPLLELQLGELPVVHQDVVAVVVVIAVLALAPDPLDELVARVSGARAPADVIAAPPCRRTRLPSPRPSTRGALGRVVAQQRVGVVQVDEDPALRRAGRSGGRGSRPDRPPAHGPCPPRAWCRARARDSSSLDQKVPSKNTQSARLERAGARRVASPRRPREVGQDAPGRALADPEPDAVLGVGRCAGLEVDRRLARHRDASTRRPVARPSRSASSSSLPSRSERQVTWPGKRSSVRYSTLPSVNPRRTRSVV